MSAEFYAWYRQLATAFAQRYMEPDGRIFDPENGGISHSESQAYDMAVAFAANMPEAFDRIWTWTRQNMRNADGLHAWKYVPGRGVVDRNNATDADLIIAAILSLAAKRWDRGDYLADAAQTASALGEAVPVEHRGHVVMLPGKVGFMPPSQPDGPVVNLSYYHFDMMQIVADLAPHRPWPQAIATGWFLYQRVLTNQTASDWSSVRDPERPVPARNFPLDKGGGRLVRPSGGPHQHRGARVRDRRLCRASAGRDRLIRDELCFRSMSDVAVGPFPTDQEPARPHHEGENHQGENGTARIGIDPVVAQVDLRRQCGRAAQVRVDCRV